ncbi:MAG: hypothetical protein ACREQ5_36065 [Candidatus Dormibacteria bacterium]
MTALRRKEALALLRSRIAQIDAARDVMQFVETDDLEAGHAELLALKAAKVEAEAKWVGEFIGRIEAGAYRFVRRACISRLHQPLTLSGYGAHPSSSLSN